MWNLLSSAIQELLVDSENEEQEDGNGTSHNRREMHAHSHTPPHRVSQEVVDTYTNDARRMEIGQGNFLPTSMESQKLASLPHSSSSFPSAVPPPPPPFPQRELKKMSMEGPSPPQALHTLPKKRSGKDDAMSNVVLKVKRKEEPPRVPGRQKEEGTRAMTLLHDAREAPEDAPGRVDCARPQKSHFPPSKEDPLALSTAFPRPVLSSSFSPLTTTSRPGSPILEETSPTTMQNILPVTATTTAAVAAAPSVPPKEIEEPSSPSTSSFWGSSSVVENEKRHEHVVECKEGELVGHAWPPHHTLSPVNSNTLTASSVVMEKGMKKTEEKAQDVPNDMGSRLTLVQTSSSSSGAAVVGAPAPSELSSGEGRNHFEHKDSNEPAVLRVSPQGATLLQPGAMEKGEDSIFHPFQEEFSADDPYVENEHEHVEEVEKVEEVNPVRITAEVPLSTAPVETTIEVEEGSGVGRDRGREVPQDVTGRKEEDDHTDRIEEEAAAAKNESVEQRQEEDLVAAAIINPSPGSVEVESTSERELLFGTAAITIPDEATRARTEEEMPPTEEISSSSSRPRSAPPLQPPAASSWAPTASTSTSTRESKEEGEEKEASDTSNAKGAEEKLKAYQKKVEASEVTIAALKREVLERENQMEVLTQEEQRSRLALHEAESTIQTLQAALQRKKEGKEDGQQQQLQQFTRLQRRQEQMREQMKVYEGQMQQAHKVLCKAMRRAGVPWSLTSSPASSFHLQQVLHRPPRQPSTSSSSSSSVKKYNTTGGETKRASPFSFFSFHDDHDEDEEEEEEEEDQEEDDTQIPLPNLASHVGYALCQVVEQAREGFRKEQEWNLKFQQAKDVHQTLQQQIDASQKEVRELQEGLAIKEEELRGAARQVREEQERCALVQQELVLLSEELHAVLLSQGQKEPHHSTRSSSSSSFTSSSQYSNAEREEANVDGLGEDVDASSQSRSKPTKKRMKSPHMQRRASSSQASHHHHSHPPQEAPPLSYEKEMNALLEEKKQLESALHQHEEEAYVTRQHAMHLQEALDRFQAKRQQDVVLFTEDLQKEVETLQTQLTELTTRATQREEALKELEAQRAREQQEHQATLQAMHQKLQLLRRELQEQQGGSSLMSIRSPHSEHGGDGSRSADAAGRFPLGNQGSTSIPATSSSSQGFVDKSLVAHVFVTFLHAFFERRKEAPEMLKVLSGLLEWDEEMQIKVGLLPGPGNPQPPSTASFGSHRPSAAAGGGGGRSASFASLTSPFGNSATPAGGGGVHGWVSEWDAASSPSLSNKVTEKGKRLFSGFRQRLSVGRPGPSSSTPRPASFSTPPPERQGSLASMWVQFLLESAENAAGGSSPKTREKKEQDEDGVPSGTTPAGAVPVLMPPKSFPLEGGGPAPTTTTTAMYRNPTRVEATNGKPHHTPTTMKTEEEVGGRPALEAEFTVEEGEKRSDPVLCSSPRGSSVDRGESVFTTRPSVLDPSDVGSFSLRDESPAPRPPPCPP